MRTKNHTKMHAIDHMAKCILTLFERKSDIFRVKPTRSFEIE